MKITDILNEYDRLVAQRVKLVTRLNLFKRPPKNLHPLNAVMYCESDGVEVKYLKYYEDYYNLTKKKLYNNIVKWDPSYGDLITLKDLFDNKEVRYKLADLLAEYNTSEVLLIEAINKYRELKLRLSEVNKKIKECKSKLRKK